MEKNVEVFNKEYIGDAFKPVPVEPDNLIARTGHMDNFTGTNRVPKDFIGEIIRRGCVRCNLRPAVYIRATCHHLTLCAACNNIVVNAT